MSDEELIVRYAMRVALIPNDGPIKNRVATIADIGREPVVPEGVICAPTTTTLH
jgi:hypothetical protein